MGNNSKNIIKIPVNGEDVLKAIKAAGYSIRSISEKIGFGDKTLRTYLKRNEMPVLMLNAIEKVVGDSVFFPGYKFTEQGDSMGRQILNDVSGMSVNDTTNSLTTRIILGREEHPIDEKDDKVNHSFADRDSYGLPVVPYPSKNKDDKVNHPNHYTFGSIEVINYIRDKMTPDEFQGYCMGNILKYISRHKHKNGVEDLKKAQVYLGWLIESEEGAE